MDRERVNVCLPPATAALMLFLLPGCKRFAQEQTRPDLGTLKDVLEKSAAAQLPEPVMTEGRLVVRQPADLREAAAERLAALARACGGTALRRDLAGGEVELLVQLPANAADSFRRQAAGGTAPPPSPPSDDTVFVEVLLADPEAR